MMGICLSSSLVRRVVPDSVRDRTPSVKRRTIVTVLMLRRELVSMVGPEVLT